MLMELVEEQQEMQYTLRRREKLTHVQTFIYQTRRRVG